MTPHAVVRLGAVDYLNVRPLVFQLDRAADRVSLRFDVPSVCAQLLADGAIDLGMVPSITHPGRPDDAVVPGVCIGSEGPVASVALFTRKPIAEVHSIALDTSSRTSAALTRVLCAQLFQISPSFVDHPPDLDAMLAKADAALLIGDPALFADANAHGAAKIDLGEAWTSMTARPFVWAFWAGPDTPDSAAIVPLLQAAAEQGMANTDAIARAYLPDAPDRWPLAERYLREHLRFRLDDRALEGLQIYYREAHRLGLVPRPAASLRFLGAMDDASRSHHAD